MKKLLVIFFLLLSQCSIYDLSFDNFKPTIITEAAFTINSPTGVTTNDTLYLNIDIQHPGYIQSISCTGDYEEYIYLEEASQSIKHTKEIPLSYDGTFVEESGEFTFTANIHTKNLSPFSTNVTINIYRESMDNIVISHPKELNANNAWVTENIFSI